MTVDRVRLRVLIRSRFPAHSTVRSTPTAYPVARTPDAESLPARPLEQS